mmetsp:Transcript_20287/g.29760  ORF Transcript_20287/g.29760 Transcript_20287/m.29760 type:complete len:177 (+) Transcript_20287:329-859(+)
MARRMEEEEEEEQNKLKKLNKVQVYSGQILDHDDLNPNGEDDEKDDAKSWMNTVFQCKKHVDHLSKGTSSTTNTTIGGDGRDMNDYLVIDGKNKRGDEDIDHHGRNHHRSHHHHHEDKTNKDQRRHRHDSSSSSHRDRSHRNHDTNDTNRHGGSSNRRRHDDDDRRHHRRHDRHHR